MSVLLTILTTSSQIVGTARLPTDTAAVHNAALRSQAVCQLGSAAAQSLNHGSSSAISNWRTANKLLSDPGIPGVRSMGPSLSKYIQDLFET